MVADIRRTRKADRTRNLRRHVRQNVAIEIRHHHHVERFRRIRQFGRADVDDPVLFLDIRVLRADLVEDLVEETVGHLHDVVFREAGDLFAAVLLGVFESEADDLFAAGARDELEALHHVGLSWYSMPA